MNIKPYPKNAKRHPDKQLKQIALSLKEYGWQQPIVVDKNGVIIVGHGRWEAYKKYPDGIAKPKINVAKDLTPEQVRGYRLMDNKTNESDWDMALAVEELKELDSLGFDIDLTGFDKDLLIEPDEKDDQIPGNAPTRAKLGDIWQLGRHRVMCGDSTQKEAVLALMGDTKAELLFTSPPYSDMREYRGGKDLKVSNLVNFIPTFEPYADYQVINLGIQRKNGEVYEYWNEYIKIARDVGYKFLSWNIWQQGGAGSIGKQSALFPIEHEWLFIFGKEVKYFKRTEEKKKKGKKTRSTHTNKDGTREKHNVGRVEGYKALGTVFELPSDKTPTRLKHPAIFPVLLPQKFITVMTNLEDYVIDPFLGSGSTLIACEKTGRICYGMELEPKYIDVIIQRYEDYTGNKAVKTAK